MSFTTVWAQFIVWAAFGLLAVILMWLGQRLGELSASHTVQSSDSQMALKTGFFVSSLVFSFLLPWLCVYCYGLRGFEVATWGGLIVSNGVLRVSSLCLLIPLINFVILASNQYRHTQTTMWAVERLGCIIMLQISWILAFQSTSLLGALLWFEIAGLLAVLILGFYGFSEVTVTSWRTRGQAENAQRGLVFSLLTLLWINGLSTILILWAWGLGYVRILALDFEFISLLVTHAQAYKGTRLGGNFGYLIGMGVLLKLLLQPMQFLALSFYRALPLSAFVVYLTAYYSMFLIATFSLILGPLNILLAPWSLFIAATLFSNLCVLVGGLEYLIDIRTVLSLSTMLNLSLLLIGFSVIS